MPSVLVPWSDVTSNRPNNPLTGLANAGRRAICQVRQAFPYLFAYSGNGLPPTVNDFLSGRQFWDDLCTEHPLPPSSQDEVFRGGQCAIGYTVCGTHLRTDLSDQTFCLPDIQGPLQRVSWRRVQVPSEDREDFAVDVIDANGVTRSVGIGSQQISRRTIYDRYITIQPQTPNCGDRTVIPTLPVTPPPNVVNVTNIQLGGQQINTTVNLPDLNTTNWPDFTFSPSVDLGGINFQFTLGGIVINLPDGVNIPGTSSSVDLSPVLNRIDEQTLAIRTDISGVVTEIDNLGTLIDERFDDLESLIRCCCCEENVSYEITTLVTNSSGGRYQLPDNCVAIRIIGSDIDVGNIRVQPGSGTSPSVYFWGWYSIAYDNDDGGERVPLSFVSTAVAALPRAQYIAVCPYFGAKCTVIAVAKNKNCSTGG